MSDYYIRSWDPDSTYPADPQEGDVCYTITLDQSCAPVAGVKNDNLVKEEVYQSGNWVEVGGGGGDTKTVIYDGDITTTEFDGQFGGEVTPDTPFPYDSDAPREGCPETITVVFNGTTYSDVPWDADYMQYGSSDFSEYPFVIGFYSESEEVYDHLWMMTASAGTYSVKVSADVSGGGGSSNYSTCTLTVNNTSSKAVVFAIAHISGDMSGSESAGRWDETQITAVLYHGSATFGMYQFDNLTQEISSVSGDIEFNGSTEFTITGDGTITVSDI